MKTSPLRGGRPLGVGVLMTSLLFWTLLLPSRVSGASTRKELICQSGQWSSGSCGSPSCCTFIFSFGEVKSSQACESGEGCEGEDNSCVQYGKDPFGRTIKCLCTTPRCNVQDRWEKDPVFKAWITHPENEKENKTATCGGVVLGGKGDLATVTALLVITALLSLRHFSVSVPFVLLTLGATFLLLPSTVKGQGEGEDVTDSTEAGERHPLTCLSSLTKDRRCFNNETCCYYLFRPIPNWDCSRKEECEGNQGGCWGWEDFRHGHSGLLCTCNTDNCNSPDAWAEDYAFKSWKAGQDKERDVNLPPCRGLTLTVSPFLILLLMLFVGLF